MEWMPLRSAAIEYLSEHWKAAILSVILLRVVGTIIHRRWLHPLAKFPGPFWGSITNLYSVQVNWSGKQYLIHHELHKKYGPIVRYRPNLLIVSDPTALPEIYHRYADKTPFYTQIIGDKTTFTSLPSTEHTISRKRISPAYAPAYVRSLEPKMDQWIVDWTELNRRVFLKSGPVKDFNNRLMYMAYDLLSDLTFGRPFGFMAKNGDVNEIIKGASVSRLMHHLLALVPSFLWLLRNTFLGYYILPRRYPDRGFGYLMAEAKRLTLSEEVNPPGGEKTPLRIMHDTKSTDGQTMGMERLASEARILLIGGAEPAAAITIEFLLNVLAHPGAYQKILDEIAAAEAAGRLSSPVATYEECQNLTYFSTCFKETLRGAETTRGMMPRYAPKGGLTIAGQFVPEGTHLSATPWVTHRTKSMYGEDAEMFRPERWLEASPETLLQWNKYDFQFGYGARVCPGKMMGLMVLYKQTLEILRHFEIRKLKEDDPKAACFTRKLDDEVIRDTGLYIHALRK
ncbi:cytochrome P450 [Sphaerosporella brunnea]|uniref:Cytochrome P450 n=1 Tax=Sphaerosporella brunnea TaxID=1250544 RepID=A0A5J5ER95_9PEZI|nr:cytochrome P450 [Sphaerosporella brunnea]